MSIRHCKNATTLQQQRNSFTAGNETVAVGVVVVENNTNLARVDTVGPGTPIVYLGFDHIPVGTAQYDENPIP